MRPMDCYAGQPTPDCDEPTPDVWWGEDGIDALIWADPLPYADPLSTAPPAETATRAVPGETP